jgi:hypothetical protein
MILVTEANNSHFDIGIRGTGSVSNMNIKTALYIGLYVKRQTFRRTHFLCLLLPLPLPLSPIPDIN